MSHSHIPNLISLLRIVLVGPVVWLLLSQEFGWALILFGIAGVSDALDGFLAKRCGWESRLGTLLDPLADKMLLVSCYVVLGVQGIIPPWLVALVILRDVVIVTGALVYHFQIEQLVASPLLISKLNTAAQILLVIVVALHNGPLPLPEEVLSSLIWLVALTTLWSGGRYVWIWGSRALRAARCHQRGNSAEGDGFQ